MCIRDRFENNASTGQALKDLAVHLGRNILKHHIRDRTALDGPARDAGRGVGPINQKPGRP
eukprot:9794530-Alexandrium_andersonii.AAC.1